MIQNTAAQRLSNTLRPVRSTSSIQHRRQWAFSPHSFASDLTGVTIALLGFHLVFSCLLRDILQSQNHTTLYLAGLFDLQGENNIPAMFSALLLLFASGLLLFIYRTGQRFRHSKNWQLLSFLFFFLALDEAFAIHEKVSVVAYAAIPHNFNGWLGWAWVLPYGVATLFVFIYFLGFMTRLPLKTGRLFCVAGSLYVFSALCMEMLESYILVNHGRTMLFRVISDVEEVLEMAAVILFLYALLDYISPKKRQIIVRTES